MNFRELHETGLLLLPNAWDAGSARLIESRGARAIATTSAGLAWSCGYADGNALPTSRLLSAVRDIARVIRIPLSVDIESGYADEPAAVAALVEAMLDAGAAGINIEDGAAPPELLCRKIAAIRESADRSGLDLFINARTDVYLRGLAGEGDKVGEVMRRAGLYRSAGCDGLFVPGLSDLSQIGAISAACAPAPLNIMLVPGLASYPQLQANGVRRLSAGASIAQGTLALAGRLTGQFLAGDTAELFADGLAYGEINALFGR